MSLKNPKIGPNHTPAYQTSGIPFVTSSATPVSGVFGVNFPYVTRDIYIKCTDGSDTLYVGFTERGASTAALGNRFSLGPGESVTLDLRAKSLFLTGDDPAVDFEIVAGLTMIQWDQFPVITGSNGFLGVG